jgi:hypothetical protein
MFQVDWMRADSNMGYGTEPIPNSRDQEISGLLQSWRNQEAGRREKLALTLSAENRFTLLAYSERMATLAVRIQDVEYVILGLIALGIDGWKDDCRDNMVLLCLHNDATIRLGMSTDIVFCQAGEYLTIATAEAVMLFLERSANDKSLESMGYVVGEDTDGFRYRRTW